MRRLPLLISVVALLVSVFLFYRITVLEGRTSAPKDHPGTTNEEEEHKEIELAIIMGRMQRFHQKWWLAGKAGNAELSRFYLHELEEAMEEIADAKVVDDGKDVSAAMNTYGLPMITRLEQVLDQEGVAAMHKEAGVFANACTSCHMATGHAYIRIVVPVGVEFPDQVFSPE